MLLAICAAIGGLAVVMCAPVDAAPMELLVAPSGAISVSQSGRNVASIQPGLFEAEWQGAGLGSPASWDDTDKTVRRGRIKTPSGVWVDCELRPESRDDAAVLRYRLTPEKDVELNSLHVTLGFAESLLAGGSYVADEDSGDFPREFGDVHLRAAATKDLELTFPDGRSLRLEYESPTPVLLQDDRQWGPTFAVRMGPQMSPAERWPGGKTLEIAFTLTSSEGVQMALDDPVTIEQGEDWVPLDLSLDIEAGSPLDFSEFGQLDAPAGKHGHILARPDGQLVFENLPDEAQRFYGVNFCFTAQYITHEQADTLADRLMHLGYNTVRFHHFEGTLVDRSGGTSTGLKPTELDQLDYLFSALKKRGIYVTIDLYISRPVYASEVFPGAEGNVAMDEFKMLVPVNERAFENWKAFARNLLTHRNEHTGMTWGEDPALGWISMINEGNFGNFIGRLEGRARDDWQRAWNEWLVDKYATRQGVADAWEDDPEGDPAAGQVSLSGGSGARGHDLSLFLADTERDMFVRMREFLHEEIGTQALLTNMNGWSNTVQTQLARREYDYVDDHFYVDHPQFLEQSWRLPSRCGNNSPVAAGAPGGRNTAFTRMLDKPFTISEYNYSGPGRFRGVGGIITGCMAALQDWSVVWRFAYSHSRDNLFQPSTAGYFDLATDPLNQAAERASLCLFLRRDMQPARHTLGIELSEEALRTDRSLQRGLVPSWNALALVTKVGTYIEGDYARADLALKPTGDDTVDPYGPAASEKVLAEIRKAGWLADDNVTDLAAKRLESETGELLVDAPRDVLALRTPMTAGCYAPTGETVDAGAVSITIERTDATVWVSSLDGKPISESNHLLVTHLTDLQNTEARFGEHARQTLLSWGRLPHLVRTGEATVRIKRDAAVEAVQAYALATSGKRLGAIAARCDEGGVTLPLKVAGESGARIMYEVVIPE